MKITKIPVFKIKSIQELFESCKDEDVRVRFLVSNISCNFGADRLNLTQRERLVYDVITNKASALLLDEKDLISLLSLNINLIGDIDVPEAILKKIINTKSEITFSKTTCNKIIDNVSLIESDDILFHLITNNFPSESILVQTLLVEYLKLKNQDYNLDINLQYYILRNGLPGDTKTSGISERIQNLYFLNKFTPHYDPVEIIGTAYRITSCCSNLSKFISSFNELGNYTKESLQSFVMEQYLNRVLDKELLEMCQIEVPNSYLLMKDIV